MNIYIVFIIIGIIVSLILWFALKKEKKYRTPMVVTVWVVIIVCSWLNAMLPSKPKSDTSSAVTNAEKSKKVKKASFKEIYKAYRKNELRADEMYEHNRYKVKAKVNGMTDDGLLNFDKSIKLTLETKIDNTIVFFYADFGKEEAGNLKKIDVGDTIVFEGECLDAYNWAECKIVNK